jgi:hypothetical protein
VSTMQRCVSEGRALMRAMLETVLVVGIQYEHQRITVSKSGVGVNLDTDILNEPLTQFLDLDRVNR